MCAVSGGWDSDVVVDMITHVDDDKIVDYVFYDTGIEYAATKKHLDDLESKYGIKIHRERAVKSIPTCCKEYGVPWFSKRVSDYISRLQKHGFQWEDESLEALLKKYPKCKVALRWWCNDWPPDKRGHTSSFNIASNRFLKEFLMAHPPTFKISYDCCKYAKKMVAERFQKRGQYGMEIVGVRQAEGGVRSTAYKSCFTSKQEGGRNYEQFRPIWWFSDKDKEEYCSYCNVTPSKCYTEYGLKRTGCVGCPFSSRFEEELEVLREHEPAMFKLCNAVFGQAYEYYRLFRRFKEEQKQQ